MASLVSAKPPGIQHTSATFDRVAAAALMVVLSPVMLLAALAVLLSGPGEICVLVPVVQRDGSLGYRWAFRISPRFEPVTYDEAARRSKSWLTPVGVALRVSGVARLPVLFDICAGRVGLANGLAA